MAGNVRGLPRRVPTPGASDSAWKLALRQRGQAFVGDEANVLVALNRAPNLQGLIRFNEFLNIVEFAKVPEWRTAIIGEALMERDFLALQNWLQLENIDVRARGVVTDCVELVARNNLFHPVREYLESLKWDHICRLDSYLADWFQADGDGEYLGAVGAKFLISAVARILRPGCQVDHVLVLEGDQGTGKTSAVRILGGEWVADGLPNLHDKDAAIHLHGVWIVELAELAAMRRSDLESAKAFISRTKDRYRPPYGRISVEVPRQSVFIATTNERQYLRDPSGNRRFWPVKCGAIDLAALAQNRDQLWAEAVTRYRLNAAWHLTYAEAALAAREQSERVHVTELEQQVGEFLDLLLAHSICETTMKDVLVKCVGLDPGDDRYSELSGRLGPQVVTVMNRNGWQRVRAVGRGPNRRVVYRHQPQTHTGSQG